jgi:hypothetical protein
MHIAGLQGNVPTTMVEWCDPSQTAFQYWPFGYRWTNAGSPVQGWQKPPPLNNPRAECCSVILPDATILVLGDGSIHQHKTPELLAGGQWRTMLPEASRRDHHAVALLLPSGRVLSASGNNRSWDFQLYDPEYLTTGGVRPAWTGAPVETLHRGSWNTVPISLPPGSSLGSVVLIRPGSLTHHADMDQRYVELPAYEDPIGYVTFKAPSGPPLYPPPADYLAAPLGYYMLFLTTSQGVPSVAQFVRFM